MQTDGGAGGDLTGNVASKLKEIINGFIPGVDVAGGFATIGREERRECCNGMTETQKYGSGSVSFSSLQVRIPGLSYVSPKLAGAYVDGIFTVDIGGKIGVYVTFGGSELDVQEIGERTTCDGEECDYFRFSGMLRPSVELIAEGGASAGFEILGTSLGIDLGSISAAASAAEMTINLDVAHNLACDGQTEGSGVLSLQGMLGLEFTDNALAGIDGLGNTTEKACLGDLDTVIRLF